ncbi:hypothetical protein PGT21_015573 [Puccinia graminis f. sp. tritici]|uniref:Uncharacterized protein n=1 Tax=Puccinia graminis f. sp. tritici TaxID=56615 RepID=A0A5B0P2J7_PUCGR|nr:hypothetical protein PGTUg99_017986 [Puccinia graminis f. sp. tritici]KAA1094269.1 hypothetical protein PGT21_015573 [Puccinia graminis f. sp. tritici]
MLNKGSVSQILEKSTLDHPPSLKPQKRTRNLALPVLPFPKRQTEFDRSFRLQRQRASVRQERQETKQNSRPALPVLPFATRERPSLGTRQALPSFRSRRENSTVCGELNQIEKHSAFPFATKALGPPFLRRANGTTVLPFATRELTVCGERNQSKKSSAFPFATKALRSPLLRRENGTTVLPFATSVLPFATRERHYRPSFCDKRTRPFVAS